MFEGLLDPEPKSFVFSIGVGPTWDFPNSHLPVPQKDSLNKGPKRWRFKIEQVVSQACHKLNPQFGWLRLVFEFGGPEGSLLSGGSPNLCSFNTCQNHGPWGFPPQRIGCSGSPILRAVRCDGFSVPSRDPSSRISHTEDDIATWGGGGGNKTCFHEGRKHRLTLKRTNLWVLKLGNPQEWLVPRLKQAPNKVIIQTLRNIAFCLHAQFKLQTSKLKLQSTPNKHVLSLKPNTSRGVYPFQKKGVALNTNPNTGPRP